ncbi:glycosyltransferase family 4 protein [Desertifilum sp. FACHB-1129]|uniref:Glycosyl transferase family 1 n=1 Tax=Desertifilum tharense IPPAS B-1220 TaxID=1781255 RepID=A0A1E5QFG5_9CYAN|nr:MULTISPECIES: glycosyltransferase [Desertifilum]MDA0213052.1 glycosyltransferase [Cyanobacteria bacterium FC1]MBD2314867.1 glycosyltransferase family 4 protein [Desertifilum sp. FACHB-1129]MBD2324860.1 glycosyltransferase family 4 protein [Desertifilum sp. FACHB-866]MBD2334892.1 glycosyltransferase family 4 protein [Desertifilum sp. FACHB-868]OEJ73341.1 glycosyl transferase family 1 [Desertifilum tharense IPPAS B-1220]
MGRGDFQRHRQYLMNPDIRKPLDEIYADLDAFTQEIFETDTERFSTISFYNLLPPLFYEGRFIKGIYFSESVDLLNKVFPQLAPVFFSFAYSMWCSYPWSTTADAYCKLYDNPSREAWFQKNYPDRAKKILIPLMDSDFTHEYLISPRNIAQKQIDVICVARLSEEKNLPIVAQALKIYHQKYPHHPIRLRLMVCRPFDLKNPQTLEPHSLREWQKIEAILGNPFDYLEVIPQVDYYAEMPVYYSHAKLCIMTSLLEGKNRSILEAMSCNIPVVCFQEYNQYARGDAPIFPEGAGLCAAFYPESLADTIYQVLQNLGEFHPRRRFLEHWGRKNFFNRCLDSFPYYRENVPDYIPGQAYNNLWLDLALQQNYQVSLHDFLYGRSQFSHLYGLQQIKTVLERWIKLA